MIAESVLPPGAPSCGRCCPGASTAPTGHPRRAGRPRGRARQACSPARALLRAHTGRHTGEDNPRLLDLRPSASWLASPRMRSASSSSCNPASGPPGPGTYPPNDFRCAAPECPRRNDQGHLHPHPHDHQQPPVHSSRSPLPTKCAAAPGSAMPRPRGDRPAAARAHATPSPHDAASSAAERPGPHYNPAAAQQPAPPTPQDLRHVHSLLKHASDSLSGSLHTSSPCACTSKAP